MWWKIMLDSMASCRLGPRLPTGFYQRHTLRSHLTLDMIITLEHSSKSSLNIKKNKKNIKKNISERHVFTISIWPEILFWKLFDLIVVVAGGWVAGQLGGGPGRQLRSCRGPREREREAVGRLQRSTRLVIFSAPRAASQSSYLIRATAARPPRHTTLWQPYQSYILQNQV